MSLISRLAAAGAVALIVGFTPPSLAQVVVFDPNNYAQNVLTAARALQQINNQITSLQDALRVRAGVVANLENNRTQMSALVTSSQSATGALQATQAGNQLSALLAQQLADLTATVVAQGRAQNLEAAQRTSAQDQGR